MNSVTIEQNTSYLDVIFQLAALKRSQGQEVINQIMEAWEDHLDYLDAVEASKEFHENPITYTHEEIKKDLGL